MLISDEYRKQQAELHKNPNYGVASESYAPIVAQLLKQTGASELLDYGAGKGRLGHALAKQHIGHSVMIDHYEPSNPEWEATPEPSDFVCCIDVLEHIEPECLDSVLDDLQRVTRGFGFFTIHTGPAVKVLPDGRNAHLIQEGAEWWLPKIMQRFELRQFTSTSHGFNVIVQPKTVIICKN